MNFDLFRAFAQSNDINQQKDANRIVEEQLTNPELISFILNTFLSPEVQNDSILPASMGVIFHYIVKKLWSEDLFKQYDSNLIQAIRSQVIPMYFSPNLIARRNIIGAIGIIIRFEDIAAEDIIKNVIQLLQNSPSIEVIEFAFSLFADWTLRVKLIQKDKVKRGDQFMGLFLQIWCQIGPHLQQLSNQTYRIFGLTAIIMKRLITVAVTSIQKPEVLQICQFFLDVALLFESDETDCLYMKRKIIEFFSGVFKPKKAYITNLQRNILPAYIKIIPTLYLTLSRIRDLSHDNALAHLLFSIFTLMVNKVDVFYTPEFVSNILVPSARLTEDDILDFEATPERYIAQNLMETEGSKIPRIVCCKIAAKFFQTRPEAILSFDATQGGDPFVMEAWLYMIGQAHSLHLNTKYAYMSPQLFSSVLSLAVDNNSAQNFFPLLPTVLFALKNETAFANIDVLKTVSSLAYQIVLTNPNIVVQVMALDLFRSTIITMSDNNLLLQLVDVSSLIRKTLEISHSIHTNVVAITMQNLIAKVPDAIIPYSGELLREVLNTWFQINNMEEELTEEQEMEVEELIGATELLIDIQNNQEVIQNMARFVKEFAMESMRKYPNSSSIKSILELVSSTCVKMGQPASFMFEFVPFAYEYIKNFESAIYLLREFSGIFCALMPSLSEELVKVIVCLCDEVLSNTLVEPSTTACALIILADIVQVHGTLDLAQRALFIMQQEYNDQSCDFLTIGSIYLLTAALFATNGEFTKNIPENVILKWYDIAEPTALMNKRNVHTCALGLLLLAKGGNANAFEVATQLLLMDFQIDHGAEAGLEGDELEGEDYMDGFGEEDMLDDEEAIISDQVVIPTDKASHSELFIALANQFGVLGKLPPEFVQKMQELSNAAS